MREIKHIAVFTTMEYAYCRDVLEGVLQFAVSRPDWHIQRHRTMQTILEPALSTGPVGIIAHLSDLVLAKHLLNSGLPVVNTSGYRSDLDCPRVGVDNVEVGRLAARLLIERGLRHFATVISNSAFGLDRARGYHEVIKSSGHDVMDLRQEPGFREGFTHASRTIRVKKLLDLPRPLGIYTEADDLAVRIVADCVAAELNVPTDIAVIGTNDDPLLCQSVHPAITSVALPGNQIGYEAAALLERMLEGAPAPTDPIILPPVGIAHRRSTDTAVYADPVVNAALREIQKSACDGLNVNDLLDRIGCSRSKLNKAFRKFMQRTPLEEIHRVRLERAKRLLASTSMRVADVATSSGFIDARALWKTFRATFNEAPEAYRERFRR